MAVLPEEGMDWLLRPVIDGKCAYIDLKNGVLDIEDIALLNDAMDVRAENETRAMKASEEKSERERNR